MILLITPSARARDCAHAIQEALGEQTQVAVSARKAMNELREQEYSAVLVDQAFLEAEPEDSEMVLGHIGMAVPVHVNFGISGMERIVRELRLALHRRKQELHLARQGAQQALRSELKSTVTALLLSCEMALRTPNLETAAEAKMRSAYQLAQELRAKLEISP